MALPLTQGQMEDWIHEQVFIKESDMSEYLRAQRFVRAADMRQLGYATGDDVRHTVIQLFHDEQAQFDALRPGMQELLDSTRALSASFSERVATASAEFADKHAATLAELTARDAQLMEHIDTAQRNSSAAFELLTAHLTTVFDSKQAELQHKVDADLVHLVLEVGLLDHAGSAPRERQESLRPGGG